VQELWSPRNWIARQTFLKICTAVPSISFRMQIEEYCSQNRRFSGRFRALQRRILIHPKSLGTTSQKFILTHSTSATVHPQIRRQTFAAPHAVPFSPLRLTSRIDAFFGQARHGQLLRSCILSATAIGFCLDCLVSRYRPNSPYYR
jgi:hypothetical protein